VWWKILIFFRFCSDGKINFSNILPYSCVVKNVYIRTKGEKLYFSLSLYVLLYRALCENVSPPSIQIEWIGKVGKISENFTSLLSFIGKLDAGKYFHSLVLFFVSKHNNTQTFIINKNIVLFLHIVFMCRAMKREISFLNSFIKS
jgi:hypothetical protein